MLLYLRSHQKKDLSLLTTKSVQVLVDFCKLAVDYLQNGPNLKLYSAASQMLEVEPEVVQNAVFGLVNLLLESCKHKLNENDFRDTVLSVGFSGEHQLVLSKLYDSKNSDITEILAQSDVKTPHYYDLEWRLEVQTASRCLRNQSEPIVTVDLSLEDQLDTNPSDVSGPKRHILLQTDPTNLVHLVQVLEQALGESRSRHVRRLQKIFQ